MQLTSVHRLRFLTQVLFTWSLVLASDCDGHFASFEGSCAKHPAPELMGRPRFFGWRWEIQGRHHRHLGKWGRNLFVPFLDVATN